MDIKEIIGLFADAQPLECEIKNTSHGEDDFREAVIARWEKGALPPELGDRMVIKLASNGFTDPAHLEMWERLAEEYRRRDAGVPASCGQRQGSSHLWSIRAANASFMGKSMPAFVQRTVLRSRKCLRMAGLPIWMISFV